MKNLEITYKIAEIKDIEDIVKLMHEYYDYDDLQFDEKIARARLHELVINHELGKIWLIVINKNIEGYIVVTNGFGLEHGRNVIIDEFYIRENYRGHGIGHKTIKYVENEMQAAGISSIHIEVVRKNNKAKAFWENLGFQKYERYLMVKMINETR
jgi:GNAT superfamily N-acetyltransferase